MADAEAEWNPEGRALEASVPRGYDPRVHCYAHAVLLNHLRALEPLTHDEDTGEMVDAREVACYQCLTKRQRVGLGAAYDESPGARKRAQGVAMSHTRGDVWASGDRRLQGAAAALAEARGRLAAYTHATAEEDRVMLRLHKLTKGVEQAHEALRRAGAEVTRSRREFDAWSVVPGADQVCYACGQARGAMFYVMVCDEHYNRLVSVDVDDVGRHQSEYDREMARRQRARAKARKAQDASNYVYM